jgi:antirestriction protein ArdC
MKNKESHTDVYTIINNRIIELLEKGVVPWQQPWAEAGLPKNLISQKQYRGINILLLASLQYSQNNFVTYKQVKELGGSVKQGEKSCPVIYWNWVEKQNKETGKMEQIPFLKYYNVFNISQCDGIPKEKMPPMIERKNDPIKSCEEIVEKMPHCPPIRHEKHRAYYNRYADYINMPRMETFRSSEDYYDTLFHELVHSSGHELRLGRLELMKSEGKHSESYAKEELTAEIGASYLKSYAGIPIETLENNAAYIEHWLGHLRNDKKFIIHASAQAQKATDYILNIKPDEKEIEASLEQQNLNECSIKRENELSKIREKGSKKYLELNL